MARIPDPSESRAILIGTSDYELSDELPHLRAVRSNLSGLESVLTDPETGVFTYEHCTVVDSPDSPSSLMRRLSRAAGEALDVLLVYYAGHGVIGRNGDLHLTVRQTDPYQAAGTAVPFEWVKQTIQDSSARVRILILDCCFSGRAIGAMSSSSAALEQIDVRGTYILTSTEANKISRANPGERYTAFTGELIHLLSNDLPADEPMTLQGLYRPLRAAMARRGLPQPKSVLGDAVGDLLLRRQPAPIPVPPKATPDPPPLESADPTPANDQIPQLIQRPQLRAEPYASSWSFPKPVKAMTTADPPTPEQLLIQNPQVVHERPMQETVAQPATPGPNWTNWVAIGQVAWIVMWWIVALFFGIGFISYVVLAATGANPPGVLGSIICAAIFAGILVTAAYVLIRAMRRRKARKSRSQ